MTEKKNELSTINDLETRLMDEDNLDEINKIVEMFNVNLQKKNTDFFVRVLLFVRLIRMFQLMNH